MIPKKWGQGQLFAFSALDGEALFSEDFTGFLCADKIGVTFNTQTQRTLFFAGMNKFIAPEIRCVTSDAVIFDTILGACSMIFARRNLIVGEYRMVPEVCLSTDGKFETKIKDGVEIHNTNDGEFTALFKENDRFALAFAKSEEQAVALCREGTEIDIKKLKEEKLSIYEKVLCKNEKYDALYSKCISVMKSQLYSPEGKIKRIWSTPDRLPHRNMWLWDSVFHAIGYRHLDSKIAAELILALFDVQRDDGFIPHMARPNYISDITQPPVIAWGAWQVYEKSGDKNFLKAVFECNKKFLLWCQENRRKTDRELYSWHTNPEKNNRCDESGMDNSPRFDTESDLYAIDLSCYMANETRFMRLIAEELSEKADSEFFSNWNNRIREDINNKLWSEADGFYYDYDINNDCFSAVCSVSSFLPLFAGICDENQSAKLLAHLENPEEFGTAFPVPSISKKDATFGTDMWRGPVWINYNYMILKGLRDYGFNEAADRIKNTSLEIINEWYLLSGTIYEFYDSENRIPPFCFNRKGEIFEPYDFRVKYQSIRDFGWSVTLAFDLLNE